MKTVLVIEDERSLARFAAINLELAGYKVVVDADADAAFRHMQRNVPDLVLLDLRLPRGSGWEFLDRMKEEERFRGIPVVIVSAYASNEDKARAAEAGVVGYLVKPVGANELIGQVEQVLGAPDEDSE